MKSLEKILGTLLISVLTYCTTTEPPVHNFEQDMRNYINNKHPTKKLSPKDNSTNIEKKVSNSSSINPQSSSSSSGGNQIQEENIDIENVGGLQKKINEIRTECESEFQSTPINFKRAVPIDLLCQTRPYKNNYHVKSSSNDYEAILYCKDQRPTKACIKEKGIDITIFYTSDPNEGNIIIYDRTDKVNIIILEKDQRIRKYTSGDTLIAYHPTEGYMVYFDINGRYKGDYTNREDKIVTRCIFDPKGGVPCYPQEFNPENPNVKFPDKFPDDFPKSRIPEFVGAYNSAIRKQEWDLRILSSYLRINTAKDYFVKSGGVKNVR